jgi:AcrR family transcriptional regulator
MRRTKNEAAKMRLKIIDSGASLFEEVGFEKTSLEAIAKKTGVTRGAIYWHFNDKTDLLKAIISREKVRLDELLSKALSQDLSPFSKLQKLMFDVVDLFYDNEQFRQYIKITWYKLSSDVFERQLSQKTIYVQDFLMVIEDLLNQSKQKKQVEHDLDTCQTAFHLSCLINGFYRLYFVAPDKACNKLQTVRLFESFFSSIQSK